MEGSGNSQESQLLEGLYESRDRLENSPIAERLSIQLQIIDAHIEAGTQTEETIIEALGDLRESACREGLSELVTRIDAVGIEHGYLKKG